MKTKNLMVGILAGVLVVALWYTMLLKPVRAKTSKVKADTANQESRLSPLQSQLARAQNDAAHASTFDAQLKSLQEAMPNSPALAAFIRDANDIAQSTGACPRPIARRRSLPANRRFSGKLRNCRRAGPRHRGRRQAAAALGVRCSGRGGAFQRAGAGG